MYVSSDQYIKEMSKHYNLGYGLTNLESEFFQLLDKQDKKKLLPDDSICHVCNNGEQQEDKMLVQCSRCNIAVHKACYGMYTVP